MSDGRDLEKSAKLPAISPAVMKFVALLVPICNTREWRSV